MKWVCPKCGREFDKDSPQGLAMAAENHLRSHGLNWLERRLELNKVWPPKIVRKVNPP